jgi:ankyrin repeat protein
MSNVVKLFLERGADPNIKNKYGATPLHKAAFSSRVDVVRLLLVHGADQTVKDEDGRTPLDLARAEGRREVVSVIEEWLRRGGGPSQRRF